MADSEIYQNPLVTRYASRRMGELWGERKKISTWRLLWITLAEAQRELGLEIGEQQLDELRMARESIDFQAARNYEKRFRHDVMAHVHAFGDAAPGARGILHLGATSCYVTDNTDLILIREGLDQILGGLVQVMRNLSNFAREHRDLPTLGFTHFQPAQLTTVGKRACLWLHDLFLDLEELEHFRSRLLLRGAKGTTGTQASFLALFDGDDKKVQQLDEMIASRLGFPGTYPVTGQTYSRKIDSQLSNILSGICQSAHKFGTDVRLLAHRNEISEPFEEEQVGSSAMAYKRNPMRCERICGLARYVTSLAANTAQTQSTQWLERTLDDSSNRRLVLPQAFLGADAVLRLYSNVTGGLVMYPTVISKSIENELPFMATENILMAAVKAGGDRQSLHETIRRHSQAAAEWIKKEGRPNDLMERLKNDPAFSKVDWDEVLDTRAYIGRAPEQVNEFLDQHIEPVLERYADLTDEGSELEV